MSNVDWVSIAPWLNSGYGQQTAIQTQLIAREHDVQISAMSGLQGTPQPWGPAGGQRVPVWSMRDSLDFIEQYVHFGADFAITLFDLWAEGSEAPRIFQYVRQAPVKMGCWLPIDTDPVSRPDLLKLQELEGIATPIAMSRHGFRMLKNAGLEPLYVPHSIDTTVFKPTEQKQCRLDLGVDPDNFVIGINAFNSIRKAWNEQLTAFVSFHKRHPNSQLLLHTVEQRAGDDGLNLLLLIADLGLEDCVGFSDQFGYRHGLLTPQYLAKWYNAIDVLSLCSLGEGFGIPYIEAQACGVPVIATNAAAASELAHWGWKVEGQPYWSAYANARLKIPNIELIDQAYEEAYQEWKSPHRDRGFTQWQSRQATVRTFAERYDMHNVYDKFWKPTLAALGAKNG
jgi:glycosyltransferase involved in cell wall biosynthesis